MEQVPLKETGTKRGVRRLAAGALALAALLAGCPTEGESGGGTKDNTAAVVSLLNLTGAVTAPVKDAVPDTTAIDTAQYTGTVAWQNAGGAVFTGNTFAASTVYKAVVTLTAKSGFTFAGVRPHSFTCTGATRVTNTAGSGTVTITFPATAALDQSAAPTATVTTVAKTTAAQAAVDFALTNSAALSGAWKVYNAAAGGDIVSGVTAAITSWPTLRLSHGHDIPAAAYYVSVTETGKTESARLALTVANPALGGTVSITGTAVVGETLTADTSALDGSGTISYQWKRADSAAGTYSDIASAAASTYTPVAADEGKFLKVAVTRAGYTGSIESAATSAVAPPVPVPVLGGTVSITGTAAVGETLTAVTSGLTGQAGTLHYQWKAGTGAVGTDQSAYTIALADYGKTITVTVTSSGNSGSVTGAAAGPVSAVTPASLASYLAGLPANTADSPHTVPLAAGTNITSNWAAITSAVQSSGRYVVLDLSACTAEGNTVTGATYPSGSDFNIIKDNQYIKGVVPPSALTSIGNDAFFNCTSLTSVTIPAGVTSIGNRAFSYCTSLTNVTVPAGVTSIGTGAFSRCTSFTSVTIPDSVTSIGILAFAYCSSLTSVTIPASVTSIKNGVFAGCTSLTSVTIPAGVTSIGNDAFYACDSLTSVTFAGSAAVLDYYNDSFPSNASLRQAGGATAEGAPMQAGTYTLSGGVWTKR
ncbi:MAG: leucine-rich repeat protein [Treponematales bacterium]